MNTVTYKDAGVDINKADIALDAVKERIKGTFNQYVLNPLGGFASLTAIPGGYEEPVLATSTDGVGTKLKIAFKAGKHSTVGIDLVAMCANDILTMGAKPFYFLDYFACGRLNETIYRDIISGICDGCEQAGCALIGGETAEMPSFYKDDEYDLAGFIVGFVDKKRIVNGRGIKEGDIIIGLASNGLHSNGFSLVRKVFFEIHNKKINEYIHGLNTALDEELLKPTKIYAKSVEKVLEGFEIKGMAHITGGGIPGNIQRIIPDGLLARVEVDEKRIPSVFNIIQELGNISTDEMCSTFNMGIGYVIIANRNDSKEILTILSDAGEDAFLMGDIEKTAGNDKVAVNFKK